jgi:hypothetical protein
VARRPASTPCRLRQRQGKSFFFEKKKQKTSAPAGFGAGVATARRTKSFFASFFSKKEVLTSPHFANQSHGQRQGGRNKRI